MRRAASAFALLLGLTAAAVPAQIVLTPIPRLRSRRLPGRPLSGRPARRSGAGRGILPRFDVESEDDPEAETADYEADEETLAGYLMAELPLGDRLKLVSGVRYESTDIEYQGKQVTLDGEGNLRGIEPVKGRVRTANCCTWPTWSGASATRTLARPNYLDLAPYELVLEEEDREIERGNPQLVLTTAWSYDLMAER